MATSKRALKPAQLVEMVITDLEQLKAISDPLRLRLLEVMTEAGIDRTWTAKEMAERLATKQTKLYHHIGILEERGFLRVAETRVVSGILEKRYQLTANSFRVDRSFFTGPVGDAAMSATLDAIFEKARREIMASLQAGLIDPRDDTDPERRRMALWATTARLSPASVRKVMRQIERLAKVDDLDNAGGDEYGLVLGFYPRAPEKGTDR